MRMRPTAW